MRIDINELDRQPIEYALWNGKAERIVSEYGIRPILDNGVYYFCTIADPRRWADPKKPDFATVARKNKQSITIELRRDGHLHLGDVDQKRIEEWYINAVLDYVERLYGMFYDIGMIIN